MRAAFLALGEALIDAIAVGLVLNDENPAIRRRSRGAKNKYARQKRREGSHAAPINEGVVLIR